MGACYATSSILYVLLQEINIPASICMGEVNLKNITFDHSWVEIEGKVIDLSISLPLVKEYYSPPIILGKDVETLIDTQINYGIYRSGLGEIAQKIFKSSFVQYMDSYPDFRNGLWDIVVFIGNQVDLKLDINILRKKYMNVKRVKK